MSGEKLEPCPFYDVCKMEKGKYCYGDRPYMCYEFKRFLNRCVKAWGIARRFEPLLRIPKEGERNGKGRD